MAMELKWIANESRSACLIGPLSGTGCSREFLQKATSKDARGQVFKCDNFIIPALCETL